MKHENTLTWIRNLYSNRTSALLYSVKIIAGGMLVSWLVLGTKLGFSSLIGAGIIASLIASFGHYLALKYPNT